MLSTKLCFVLLLAVGGVSSADHMINGATVREDNHSNEGDMRVQEFCVTEVKVTDIAMNVEAMKTLNFIHSSRIVETRKCS